MSFDWRADLILPADVQLTRVADAPFPRPVGLTAVREEFVIQRPGGRDGSKGLDADGVRLLEAFRRPRRVVDVVAALSRSSGIDPARLLDECFPLLRAMVAAGMLVPSGSADAAPLAPLLAPGAQIGDWTIDRCVRLMDDSEVYQCHHGNQRAAVKRARPAGMTRGLGQLIAREADTLRRLPAAVSPDLLAVDVGAELPWLATTWRDGRRADSLDPDVDLPAICLAIADAYASIHDRGVLHGDVHAGNVIIGAMGDVTIIDFALARLPDDEESDSILRGAAHGYWEPEYAAAMLRGEQVPVTALGEQYAVATLIDRLLAGEAAFILPAMGAGEWDAILHADRRSFAERGRDPWPTVEHVLRRATGREPTTRYAAMSDFAGELRRACSLPAMFIRRAADPVTAFLENVMPGGLLFESGLHASPRNSFNFGSAGIAFALYRISRAREDGAMLSIAQLWQARAETDLSVPGALYDVGDFRKEDLGVVSPFHATPGVWLTRAILERTCGDTANCDGAIESYLATSDCVDTAELDLTLGRSSVLLGASVLYGLRPLPSLRAAGDELRDAIWKGLEQRPPIGSEDGQYLGIAHGWAGYIYAAFAWAKATATPPPAATLERLAQLDELLTGGGPELRVPVLTPGQQGLGVQWMDGWCHGQAGHVFLHLLAGRLLGGGSHLDTAVRLGEASWSGSEDVGNLCCGLAGRAYALLALHRATDDRKWLERARSLTARATAGSGCDRWPNSLYKGRVGLAVVGAEIDRPDLAAMPLFEDEGWM
ncbi:MAG: lanthionine synthetase LanC family protein [Acidimicrobiales bacterium]